MVEEWINKTSYIHTTEYYSALKRKYVLAHATAWMNFNDIVVSGVSQSQEHRLCACYHKVPRIVKFTETESRTVFARDTKETEIELLLCGYKISVLQHEKSYGNGHW